MNPVASPDAASTDLEELARQIQQAAEPVLGRLLPREEALAFAVRLDNAVREVVAKHEAEAGSAS